MRCLCLLVGLLTALPAAARADSFLNISGVLADGGTASGQLFGNLPDPITITDQGKTYVFQGDFISLHYGSLPSGGTYEVSYTLQNNGQVPAINQGALTLAFSQSSLDAFTGGALCATSTPCTNNYPASFFTAYSSNSLQGTTIEFTSLTVTPAASITPEPSSLLLLGTGVAGLCAQMWRRRSALTA